MRCHEGIRRLVLPDWLPRRLLNAMGDPATDWQAYCDAADARTSPPPPEPPPMPAEPRETGPKFLFYCPEFAKFLGTVAVYQDADGREYRCTEVMDPDRFLGPAAKHKPRGDLIGLGVRFLRQEIVDEAAKERREKRAADLARAAMAMGEAGVPADQTIQAMYRAIHSEGA